MKQGEVIVIVMEMGSIAGRFIGAHLLGVIPGRAAAAGPGPDPRRLVGIGLAAWLTQASTMPQSNASPSQEGEVPCFMHAVRSLPYRRRCGEHGIAPTDRHMPIVRGGDMIISIGSHIDLEENLFGRLALPPVD